MLLPPALERGIGKSWAQNGGRAKHTSFKRSFSLFGNQIGEDMSGFVSFSFKPGAKVSSGLLRRWWQAGWFSQASD